MMIPSVEVIRGDAAGLLRATSESDQDAPCYRSYVQPRFVDVLAAATDYSTALAACGQAAFARLIRERRHCDQPLYDAKGRSGDLRDRLGRG